MLFCFFSLILFTFSITEEDPEIEEILYKPAFLSDFINSRQLRNITLSGKSDLMPISSTYFYKPLFELQQSLQPTFFTLRTLTFKNFDGMLLNGESRGLAKFPDVFIYDCNFKDGTSGLINIQGPSVPSYDSE